MTEIFLSGIKTDTRDRNRLDGAHKDPERDEQKRLKGKRQVPFSRRENKPDDGLPHDL